MSAEFLSIYFLLNKSFAKQHDVKYVKLKHLKANKCILNILKNIKYIGETRQIIIIILKTCFCVQYVALSLSKTSLNIIILITSHIESPQQFICISIFIEYLLQS